MIKIVIVNDVEQEQNRIYSLLSNQQDFEVTGFGRDSYDALKLAEKYRPHIIIIDLRQDTIGGPELVPLIKRRSPSTAIIILSGRDDDEYAGRALSAGALGYLIKKTDMDKLADSVRAVHGGGCFISATITIRAFGMLSEITKYRHMVPAFSPAKSSARTIPSTINRTELRIMAGIAKGGSTKEIAEKLRLKPGTVRNYLSAAMHKAGLKNRTQAALFAIENGLIKREKI
jgi:DNA-binding NarL/FixJ family response regulator